MISLCRMGRLVWGARSFATTTRHFPRCTDRVTLIHFFNSIEGTKIQFSAKTLDFGKISRIHIDKPDAERIAQIRNAIWKKQTRPEEILFTNVKLSNETVSDLAEMIANAGLYYQFDVTYDYEPKPK